MAITRPVTFSQAIMGDGETTLLALDLAPQIAQQGLPVGAVPQLLVSVTVSDGSPVTAVLSGQSISITFVVPPAALAIRTLVIVLGF